MSIFNAIFGEDNKAKLFQRNNFETIYLIKVNNEFIMGKETPVIKLETESEVALKQEFQDGSIINTIENRTIKGNTEHQVMKPHLEQMIRLKDISKRVVIERDLNGKMRSILNMPTLYSDWKKWKETKIHNFLPDDSEQQKFIHNYEKGLENMIEGSKKAFNIQYCYPKFITLKSIYPINILTKQV